MSRKKMFSIAFHEEQQEYRERDVSFTVDLVSEMLKQAPGDLTLRNNGSS